MTSRPSLVSVALFLQLIVGTVAERVSAQCATQWLPGEALPGTNGQVLATTLWDPDGPGPMQPVLVLAGDFSLAGTVAANKIAIWDPVSGVWSALGTGMTGMPFPHVNALAVLPNGDLVAGGWFTNAGGAGANNIARWDGTYWWALGSGVNGNVSALRTLPNGDLVAAGGFNTAGGVSANYIARWNGSSWSALGSGTSDVVSSLTTLLNGDLVAGGWFTTAGGSSANYIARWDGTSWSALGSGMDGNVYGLRTLPNGDLVAGGVFSTAGGASANRIARWNGIAWSPLGPGILGSGTSDFVCALTTLPNGDLVAGGAFSSAGGVSASNIARWDGASWSALGPGIGGTFTPTVVTLAVLSNGDLMAGGWYTSAGGVGADNIARWNGAYWSALGKGTNRYVYALMPLPNGGLVAGGSFTIASGASAAYIARSDDGSWSALGSGMNGTVRALALLPNGDLVAGGEFTTAGGVSANYIARWDGTSWSALGSGTWPVTALMTLPNGDLLAAGWFTILGSVSTPITRWDGTSWSALGAFLNGYVYALTPLPNGDVVAGGDFTMAGAVSADCIARWNGTSWSALGLGMNGAVFALAALSNGDVVAGGGFTMVNGSPSSFLAQLTTTCPATADSFGASCTGSGGLNVLFATALPWTGAIFRSVATGMPGNGLALSVLGFATLSIPLSSILPQGVPGCALLVSPDVLGLLIPAAGSVYTQLAIPNTVSLAGQVFHQQVVAVELGAAGITALTSTNALTLTIGSF
jgi:hypothetical protein